MSKIEKIHLNIDNKKTCYVKYSDYKKMIQSYEDKLNQYKEVIEDTSKNTSVGSIINYNGFEWYIIEEKDDSFVLFMKERMSEDLIKELFTDTRMIDGDYDVQFSRDEKNNDWKDSYIRQVLNTKFLEKFIIDDLVLMKTKYDSDKESNDYIRLITIDEFEKLELSVRKVNDKFGYWIMSPRNFYAAATSAFVFFATSAGYANNDWVTSTIGVRPVIQVKKDVLGG